RTYPVHDLLAWCEHRGIWCGVELERVIGPGTAEQLIRFVTETVSPNSWSEKGGPGTIDYYPLGKALVVNQVPFVQEQVEELLSALGRQFGAEDVRQSSEPEPQAATPCPRAQAMHAHFVVRRQAAGQLMKECQKAVSEGRHHKAVELAQQAYKLDPQGVE